MMSDAASECSIQTLSKPRMNNHDDRDTGRSIVQRCAGFDPQYPLMRTEVSRAKRLPLLVPISYRAAGDEPWLWGRIVNISESGVMFTPAAVEPGQSIEVIFST